VRISFATLLCLLLGLLAVHASALKPDESVMIFPTIGWQTTNGWEIDVHGLVFEPHAHKIITRVLRRSLGIDEEELKPGEDKLFAERARYFMVDNERRKRLTIRFGARTETLSPTPANGHFHAHFVLPADALGTFGIAGALSNGVLEIETVSENKKVHPFHGEVLLVPSTGISVISDIDDTIKISQVTNRHELIRNTFLRPFQGVPGMADVYQNWFTNSKAKFHYVSASPWQLYEPLSEFLSAGHFPAGSVHLKQFRLKDRTFFDLFKSPEEYKPKVIGDLLQKFPNRRFVLVGDSGEKDPEIYGDLARKYPDQISRIFIRNVTGESSGSARYKNAFAEVSNSKWQVFEKSSEIVNGIP
jgi:phosphatidate phosphatase APP1